MIGWGWAALPRGAEGAPEHAVDCQAQVDRAFRDEEAWTRSSILNAARCGFFSSDRAMRQYAEEIWKVRPLPVK